MKKFLLLFTALLFGVAVFGQTISCVDSDASYTEPFPGGDPICEAYAAYRFEEQFPGDTDEYEGITITTISTDCGPVFSFTTDGVKVYKVFVKGGPNQNVYEYPNGATSGSGLHAPVNPSNNKYYGLSHIDFCFAYALDVSKTAETEFTRTYDWDITKSVTPTTWNLFCGDSGTSDYTVVVSNTGYTDSDWAVSGTITIENNSPFAATIESVADVISGYGDVTPSCGVTFPYVLPAGETLNCTYSASLPNGANRTNTATVTTSSPIVLGSTATAPVVFGDPTTEVNKTVNVTDDQEGNLGTATAPASATFNYSRTFDCDDVVFGSGNSASYTFNNTATIVETGESSSASVAVTCYRLAVTKDATTTFNRYWDWDIMKSCGTSTAANPWTLSPGQSYTINYSVMVSATYMDDDHAVSGSIFIHNPNPDRAATLTAVVDVVSLGIDATVNCPSLTIPAGGTLTCTYTAELPDATSRTNTATATLQNYDFASNGSPTAGGTKDFSGSAAVTFGPYPADNIDECIAVTDSYAGNLGTVCAPDAQSQTFTYARTVSFNSPDQCGPQTVENIASFTTNDTETSGNDNCTAYFNVACDNGCTLTIGYWKTHSEFGPAPYDNTWAQLLNGASTPFFLSGQTWYEVFWTSPSGNAYYNLAHQYMAAKLNILNGAATTPAVLAAISSAEGLFNTYTPAQIGALRGNKQPRPQFLSLALTLDNYNNGLIGPGHCDESDDSSYGNSNLSMPAINPSNEMQPVDRFRLFPNPAQSNVQIDVSEFIGRQATLRIYDQLGVLVWSRNYTAVDVDLVSVALDQRNFTSGVYQVSLTSEGEHVVKTLVVQLGN